MAVHGALIASRLTSSTKSKSFAGYLASVRNVSLYANRLDDIDTDLIATAELVNGDARSVLYDFFVTANERVLLSGRAIIVFNAPLREISTSSRTWKE
jgi:predicted hotdog family 3-hydroxylacyl-ACP dehydratase